MREHHRLQSGAADFVDRERRDMIRKSAFQCRLSGGSLTDSRGHHVAHDAFLDGRGLDAGAPDRLAHDHRTQLRRWEILQCTQKLAGRQPDGGNDHCIRHK